MTYATIYDLDGLVLSDGVPSQAVCDQVIITARMLSAESNLPVIVEDGGTKEAYCIRPNGGREPAPDGFVPEWDSPDDGE